MAVKFRATGDYRRLSETILQGTAREVADRLLEIGEQVAGNARARWYEQVDRRTGKSGDIRASVEVDGDRIRLRVGSTDERRAGGKPLVVYVHRPGAYSLVEVKVSAREWHAAPPEQRGRFGFLKKLNPKASDGKYLLQELVNKPMQAALGTIKKEVTKAAKKGASKGAGRRRGR